MQTPPNMKKFMTPCINKCVREKVEIGFASLKKL